MSGAADGAMRIMSDDVHPLAAIHRHHTSLPCIIHEGCLTRRLIGTDDTYDTRAWTHARSGFLCDPSTHRRTMCLRLYNAGRLCKKECKKEYSQLSYRTVLVERSCEFICGAALLLLPETSAATFQRMQTQQPAIASIIPGYQLLHP